MNLIKRFFGNDNADLEDEDYNELYTNPDFPGAVEAEDSNNVVSALDNPARKEPELHAATVEKVSLKLLQPKSHIEAARIADRLKEGCIVLLDISQLTKDQAHRLVDFLSGVAYVIGGEMIKTNKSTIVIAPAGVDVSSFAGDPEEPAEAAPAEETAEETADAEEYEEVAVAEEA